MKYMKEWYLELFSLPILVVVYFITRLYHILTLPIFTDEAIYTRWAQIAKQDSNWRFISLTDGKQPSFIWADIISMKFLHDPLLAGRIVSVIAGLITLFGIYFLTREIFKKYDGKAISARIISIIAVAIFVLYPFSLVYDRMVLYDSLVATFFVWALYFQILMVRKLRLDIAMITGFILGGAVLTKSSGFLSIYLTPFLLLLFDFSKKNLKSRFIKFIILSVVSAMIAYMMYSVLRLSPFYHIINDKNSVFIYTVSQWFHFSFQEKINVFMSNFSGLINWFTIYFTIPYILLALASFFVSFKLIREKGLLFLWFLLPFAALCIFGKTLYPRYILFMTMPLIPLVSYSLFEISKKLKQKWVVVVLFALVLFLPLRSDFYILTNFANAPIPHSELDQYINGWPAGGGVNESVAFFKDQAKKGPIYIATEGTFGLMPFAYEIYLIKNPQITIKGLWPIENTISQDLVEKSRVMPVFVVFYQPCPSCQSNGLAPSSWPLERLKTYKKGDGTNVLTVYKVLEQ